MRYRFTVCIWLLVLGVVCFAARQVPSPGEQFAGTWTGSWEGAGSSGGFELTLDKDDKGVMNGRVSVTGEPTYHAVLKRLSFDGNQMQGAYDFTPDDRAEVVLTATFDGDSATGTWSVLEKTGGQEVVNGTWTVRKPSKD